MPVCPKCQRSHGSLVCGIPRNTALGRTKAGHAPVGAFATHGLNSVETALGRTKAAHVPVEGYRGPHSRGHGRRNIALEWRLDRLTSDRREIEERMRSLPPGSDEIWLLEGQWDKIWLELQQTIRKLSIGA